MTSVIIVGAGINGLMCAHFLTRRGISVSVVDRGDIPNPTSASYGLHRLIHPWSEQRDMVIAANAIAALELWQAVLADINSTTFRQTGVVAIEQSDSEVWKDLPTETKNLCREEIAETLPFGSAPEGMSGVYFERFGFLYASQILHDLVRHLSMKGVEFHPHSAISDVEPNCGQVVTTKGTKLVADHVIIAAGVGSGDILKGLGTLNHVRFTSQRCYVAYVSSPYSMIQSSHACWASLGGGDLWGMPPSDGHFMKLGSGQFTREGNEKQPIDAMTTAPQIIAEYAALFPTMGHAKLEKAALNHWTKITAPRGHITQDRLTVITSDNGGGFKFAPFVARNAVAEVSDKQNCGSRNHGEY